MDNLVAGDISLRIDEMINTLYIYSNRGLIYALLGIALAVIFIRMLRRSETGTYQRYYSVAVLAVAVLLGFLFPLFRTRGGKITSAVCTVIAVFMMLWVYVLTPSSFPFRYKAIGASTLVILAIFSVLMTAGAICSKQALKVTFRKEK